MESVHVSYDIDSRQNTVVIMKETNGQAYIEMNQVYKNNGRISHRIRRRNDDMKRSRLKNQL